MPLVQSRWNSIQGYPATTQFVRKIVPFLADFYQLTDITGILYLIYTFSACLTVTEAEFIEHK